jgi:hypothetical protein
MDRADEGRQGLEKEQSQEGPEPTQMKIARVLLVSHYQAPSPSLC